MAIGDGSKGEKQHAAIDLSSQLPPNAVGMHTSHVISHTPADLNWPGETEVTGKLAIEHPSRHRQGTPALLHPWICVNCPSPEPRPTSGTNVRLGKVAHGQPFTQDAEVRTARPPLCTSEVSRMNKHLRQAARMASKQGQQLHAVLVVQRCCTAVGPRRQQPRAIWAAGHAGHDACAAAPQPVSPASVLLWGGC